MLGKNIITKFVPNDKSAAKMADAFVNAFQPKPKDNQIKVITTKQIELTRTGAIIPKGAIGRVITVCENGIILVDFGTIDVARFRVDSSLIEWVKRGNDES